MSTPTVYPALLPLWQEMQHAIAYAHTQSIHLAKSPRVCFVGRFKTGKSRLINALIGSDVLPYNTDECTAQLVELAWRGTDIASQLDSLDLDSASERLITVDQFQRATDLTAMSKDGERAADATAFRRYVTSHLLLKIRIIDTPGFDGADSQARERADKIREQAIRQSDLCVLVLSSGLSEDDLKCARLIQQHGTETLVVLNKSDNYDADDRLAMQDQILSELKSEAGIAASFYACSALWQNGTEQDREELERRRRYFDDEDEAQWHQWHPLLSRLSRPLTGRRHIAMLSTICSAYKFASVVQGKYDLIQQAEATFLDHLPQWRAMMQPPIGPVILEMAVSAAKTGKPLPWKRLQNFNITPELFTPKNVLPHNDLENLFGLHEKALAEVILLCIASDSVDFFDALMESVETFVNATVSLHGDGSLEVKSKLFMAKITALRLQAEKLRWFSQPLRADFTYQKAFDGLQARWNTVPDALNEDCKYIRKRLAAVLA